MFQEPIQITSAGTASVRAAVGISTRDLLLKLVDAATAVAGHDRAETKGALEKAVEMLSNLPGVSSARFVAHSRGGLVPWKARRVVAYIREHVGNSLRTSELAALVQLSNSHFNRAFKVSFEETPSAYIMRQRMRTASELMLTTSQPLSQIALHCGLCDQAHFSRMFRRFFGQSPRLWRLQCGPQGGQSGCATTAH